MGYTFVGSATVENVTPGNTVIANLSAITDADGNATTIRAGDLGYLLPLAGQSSTLSVIYTASGWTNVVGGLIRNPVGGGYTGAILEKQLAGTETTVTITDTNARGITFGCIVVVYRGVTAVGASHSTDSDPASTSTISAPWSATNPAAVTCTLPTVVQGLGAARQLVIYIYYDCRAPADFVATNSPSMIRRVNRRFTVNGDIQVEWFDELWASAADLPSRISSSSEASGGARHDGMLYRLRATAAQSIPAISPPATITGGNAWAWT